MKEGKIVSETVKIALIAIVAVAVAKWAAKTVPGLGALGNVL
jgi:hypothetical protein